MTGETPSSPAIATSENPPSGEHTPADKVEVPGEASTGNHTDTAIPPTTNQRSLDRQPFTGRARIMSAGNATQNAKVIDANAEGVSVLMDLAIKPGNRFTLHITCFRHGRSLDANLDAVCVHSTLSGRGFKTGFRFENMPEAVKTSFLQLLSQAAK